MELYTEPVRYADVSAQTCESCGRQPALRVSVRRHVGLFFLQRFVTVKAVACRVCGRKLVRNFTLRTLAQGWWGVISFFFNWFVLGSNAVAWLRLGRINEPSTRERTAWRARRARPLRRGVERATTTPASRRRPRGS